MSQRTSALIRNAIRHVVKFGIDGPRPLEQFDALDGRDDLMPSLERALRQADIDSLAATIHVVRQLGGFELADCIAEVALQRPSTLEARLEAVDTLSEAGRDVPDALLETMTQARDFLAAPDARGLAEVLAFPEGWRDAALREWLAGETVLSSGLLESILGLSAELDALVVRRLGDCDDAPAVQALRRLAAAQDKSVAKEAKRALHRLRGRGVEVAAERSTETFTLEIATDVRAEARGWITGVDGFGGRVVWLMAPAGRGGDRLLEAVIDDGEGLRKADVINVSRKGFREHVDRLRTQPAILVAQRPVDLLARVLREAEQTALQAGRELPEAWQRWRREIGDALLADASVGAAKREQALPPADTNEAREALRESVTLLADPAFANWVVLGDTAERAAREVRSAETSKLALDEAQRKQRIDQAMSEAAAVFDDRLRQRYRVRLEAMADMLLALRRPQQARLAEAAAIGFTEVRDLYLDHPFARALVQRGVLAAYQSARQQEETDVESSPILQP